MTPGLRGTGPAEGRGSHRCGPYARFILQSLLVAHLFAAAWSSQGAYKTVSTSMDAFTQQLGGCGTCTSNTRRFCYTFLPLSTLFSPVCLSMSLIYSSQLLLLVTECKKERMLKFMDSYSVLGTHWAVCLVSHCLIIPIGLA